MNPTPIPPPLPPLAEIVPLPRTQVGPFLLLGVAKDASLESVDAAWAQRLIWARKNTTETPLEDINWAREILKDQARRLHSDAATLNIDSVSGLLQALADKSVSSARLNRPIDVEKDLSAFVPAVTLPDADQVRAGLVTPEIPADVRAVPHIVADFLRTPLDPWQIFADASEI